VNDRDRPRLLVTGATGLIGRNVLAALDDGWRVYATSRAEQPSGDRVTWVRADLAEIGAAHELVREVEPDAVVHLAGAVRGDRTLDAVAPTLMANLVASVALFEALARRKVQRVVVSGSLLEEPTAPTPFAVPPSPYGASRWSSSAYARMFHALFGLPAVILRPSYAYGPGQEETKLLPYAITSLLRGERPELTSGERRVDFVFAEDVGRAYVLAVTAPGVEGATIDIGSGELTRVRDAIDVAAAFVGDAVRPEYGARPERPLEQEIEVDASVAEKLLGWRATTSLADGLRRTVEWYAAQAAPTRVL
jgi:UDP-glucose 4-epimerase